MREVILEEAEFSSAEDVHAYLARELDFPSYYGANLDALNDCLEDVDEECMITVALQDGEAGAQGACVRSAADEAADVFDSAPDAADAGNSDYSAWFPKLVRSLLRASRANENVNVRVYTDGFSALERVLACPGVSELLHCGAFSSTTLITRADNSDS